jgi:lycopene beta-cyclase
MMERCVANGVVFHQAKVAKAVHNEASSLLICDDGVGVPATVVLDATGFSRCLVQYDMPYNPGYQVAYGILAEVDGHPFDVDKMLFMDWRDSHLPEGSETKERNRRIPAFLYAMPFSPNRIFLEETSLHVSDVMISKHRPTFPVKHEADSCVLRYIVPSCFQNVAKNKKLE